MSENSFETWFEKNTVFPLSRTQLLEEFGIAVMEPLEELDILYKKKLYGRKFFSISKEVFEEQTDNLLNLVEELSKEFFPITHPNAILRKLNKMVGTKEFAFYSKQVRWAMQELERRGILLSLCSSKYMNDELKTVHKFFFHRQYYQLSKDLFYNAKRTVFASGTIDSSILKRKTKAIERKYRVKLSASWEKKILDNLVFQGLLIKKDKTYILPNTVRV